ncbi:arginine--tRNA ligase [Mesoterricola sediminis]|uniref:Arginine--tRNA ligase n=1 Tax=Mesoterricola sediminis TaxID=2927980 RepID=A0AA48HCH4_9BACT|nr:arginine--tRNA ligase [Mesoterricola sediminis]BDU75753.1 arginine--tRNA ligase [Mesoterricola sediminis]
MERLKAAFTEALAAALPGMEIVLERPRSGEMGDLAFPCFKAAKALGRNPAQVAQELAGALRIDGARIVAAGPYLNLKLEPARRAAFLLDALLGPRPYGSGDPHAETVIVEYSSPNIAKLFTIGHLRSTMIGHALAQVNRYLGANVVRINHLGDWGTQFGTLLAAYKKWAEQENPRLEEDFPWAEAIPEKMRSPLYRLFQLYVRFHAAEEEDPALRDEARAWFRRLEEGDPEARRLWSWFREISLQAFDRIYRRLGVGFDHLEMGEAFYQDKLTPTLDRLEAAGILQDGENGARIVDLEDVGIATPCLVQKADGSSIYATRDVAAALYRQDTWRFDRCLYVVGSDQILHFQQIFAVAEKVDPWFKGRMVHTPFGMVNLPEGKMSTRKGNVIFLEDVLDEAVSRVTAIIDEKNPDLAGKADVAEMLGLGAVIFFNALNDRVKPITFTWDRVIALDGDTGPYVQYAHARILSVLRKAGGGWADMARPERAPSDASAAVAYAPAAVPSDLAGLAEAPAQALLFELAGLPDAMRVMAREHSATALARQLLAVAKAFSGFYTNCPILWAENAPEVRDARLALCVATARALRQGLFLLGIQAPEEM